MYVRLYGNVHMYVCSYVCLYGMYDIIFGNNIGYVRYVYVCTYYVDFNTHVRCVCTLSSCIIRFELIYRMIIACVQLRISTFHYLEVLCLYSYVPMYVYCVCTYVHVSVLLMYVRIMYVCV
jgi:hypothetical protein